MVAQNLEHSLIGHNRPPIREILTEQHKDLLARVDQIAERANALPRKVESDDGLGPIGDLVVDASKLAKEIDGIRKFEGEPHYQAWKDVNTFFTPFVDRVKRIAEAFEKVANDYQRAKAAEARRKAEEEARKLREEEDRKRREAEAAKRQSTAERKLDEADEIADKAAEAEAMAQASNADLTRVRTESGVTAGTKTIWNFQITDYEAIPLDRLRPYLKREHIESAIRSMVGIQKGSTDLPGVRVFEDIKSTFRK